jgi:hypothetical protein
MWCVGDADAMLCLLKEKERMKDYDRPQRTRNSTASSAKGYAVRMM